MSLCDIAEERFSWKIKCKIFCINYAMHKKYTLWYLTFNNIELYNFEVRVEFKLKIKRKTEKKNNNLKYAMKSFAMLNLLKMNR